MFVIENTLTGRDLYFPFQVKSPPLAFTRSFIFSLLKLRIPCLCFVKRGNFSSQQTDLKVSTKRRFVHEKYFPFWGAVFRVVNAKLSCVRTERTIFLTKKKAYLNPPGKKSFASLQTLFILLIICME